MKLLFSLTFLLISLNSAVAQNFSELDTVYTPPGFRLGDFTATVCIPENPNGVGIVLAHGAYSAGPFQRETMKIWCDTLAANGYTAMTIDYYNLDNSQDEQIDSLAAYPGQATTLKNAVEFLRSNSDRFHVFTGKIVAFGMSAGAIHWAQTITWENDDDFFETNPNIDDHVDAAIFLYGGYDNFFIDHPVYNLIVNKHFINFPELASTKGNPIKNTAHINAPVFMAHGTADTNVPYQQSVNFHDSLLANGKSSQFITYPGRAHVFELTDWFPPHNFTQDGLELKNHILAFLDSTVLASISDIKTNQENSVQQFKLYQNYPNPFNPKTNIEYHLITNDYVKLFVYNQLGQKITTLVSEQQAAGVYNVPWDASGFSSGVYFYRLETNNGFSQTKKLILLK